MGHGFPQVNIFRHFHQKLPMIKEKIILQINYCGLNNLYDENIVKQEKQHKIKQNKPKEMF